MLSVHELTSGTISLYINAHGGCSDEIGVLKNQNKNTLDVPSSEPHKRAHAKIFVDKFCLEAVRASATLDDLERRHER